ncbi:hypothetical protein AB0I10_40760 [Streptomyces sp. NPDC050636]|uniref:DUF7683 domain-containing protein n=1 Tax=Streptomyces sp. NPDC050636 TaxID=3154510 RepID=UPI003412AE62
MKIVVTIFRKDSDPLEGVADVSGIGVEVAAKLVGIPVDRFADVYPLDQSQATALGELTGIVFDLDSYEYFLEPVAE